MMARVLLAVLNQPAMIGKAFDLVTGPVPIAQALAAL
jgi:hypothetical protein